jgi:hypothetical protein
MLWGPHQAFNVEANGQLLRADAYRSLIVAYRNGAPVRLGELGQVIESIENDKNINWFDRSRSIVLQVAEVEGIQALPPIYDLVTYNFRDARATPVFVWEMEHETILDLVLGRIKIFAQLDLNMFFQIAQAEGIKLSWVTGQEPAQIAHIARRIPGSPNAWAVRAELPDGTIHHLLAGFFGRIVYDLITPKELLTFIKRHPAQQEKLAARFESAPSAPETIES